MSVDWNQQWSLFAENFYDGKAHIDLTQFGGLGELLLEPGGGFGDLSHPTTYLMLELMQEHISKETVIDIGTGSGILSLAALKLGAQSAFGIDIDPEAILHAEKNNTLNQLNATFSLNMPLLKHPAVFLMNMIFPEQKMVQPDQWNRQAKSWITSGILEEQKEAYLKQITDWGWTLKKEKSRQGWLGFVFSVPKINLGQFLAYDKGIRIEGGRTFESGLRVGLWYTLTNTGDIVNGNRY